MFRARSSRKGFTLVELLVVTPVALLVIVGFIALMVVMVGDVIASRTFNTMTYDIQNALDTIERDVRLSTEFQTSSGELPAPQGKNGSTSPFTSTAGDLVLGAIATDKNPLDPTRRFVHYNAPFECSSEHRYKNRVFFTSVIYFVRDNSLWRRSYVPSYTPGNMCSTPWQINTCSPDYTSAQTQCQSTDSEILKDVKSFSIAYHERPEDTVEISSASASDASTIKVSIELEGRAAGRTVGASSSTRATKLSSRDVNLAPPDAPIVTGSRSGTDAVFSWPGVPTATSYIIRYNINGGGWRTASENSTETSFSVSSPLRGSTVSIEVFARNTTGTSSKATGTVTMEPLNIMPKFGPGWELTGTALYDNVANEIILGSNGTALSPLIRINQATSIVVGSRAYAGSPTPQYSPDGSRMVSTNYYASNGTTLVQNSTGHTGNGCARLFSVGSWSTPANCSFSGGPNVHFVRFYFPGGQSVHSSPNLRIKDPTLHTNLSGGANLAPSVSPSWELTGTASYNSTTGELTLGTNGKAYSPKVNVNSPADIWAGGDMFATQAGVNSGETNGRFHITISYFGSDGVTPVQNSSGYTSNGCASSFTRGSWQLARDTCHFKGGPNVKYVSYVFHAQNSGYTSPDIRIKNPLLKAAD